MAEKKQKIDNIRAEIARLNDQIKDINDEWFTTSGHGSKSYTDETIGAMRLPQILGRDFPYMKDYDHVWEENRYLILIYAGMIQKCTPT